MKVAPENTTISDSTRNVVLDCEIESDPSKTPVVSWHRNMAPIRVQKDKFEVAPNNSLIIITRNFDNLDEVKGDYLCVGITAAPADDIRGVAVVSVKEGVVPGTCWKTATFLGERCSIFFETIFKSLFARMYQVRVGRPHHF